LTPWNYLLSTNHSVFRSNIQWNRHWALERNSY